MCIAHYSIMTINKLSYEIKPLIGGKRKKRKGDGGREGKIKNKKDLEVIINIYSLVFYWNIIK